MPNTDIDAMEVFVNDVVTEALRAIERLYRQQPNREALRDLQTVSHNLSELQAKFKLSGAALVQARAGYRRLESRLHEKERELAEAHRKRESSEMRMVKRQYEHGFTDGLLANQADISNLETEVEQLRTTVAEWEAWAEEVTAS